MGTGYTPHSYFHLLQHTYALTKARGQSISTVTGVAIALKTKNDLQRPL